MKGGTPWERPRNWVFLIATVVLVAVTAWLVRAEVVSPRDPAGVRVVRDLVYRVEGGRAVRLDLLTPDRPPPSTGWPIVIAIHGGGWRGGSKSDYGASLADLARSGVAVTAIDYKLSRPGQPSWPENLDDVRAAIAWVDRDGSRYQLDRRRLALMGASAGAHLALLAAFEERPEVVTAPVLSRKNAVVPIRVRAVVDFYGPSDLSALATARGAVDLLLGSTALERRTAPEARARERAASPLRRVSPGGPPVLILHGSEDRVVPLDQSRALAQALGEAGVTHRLSVVDGARHGFGLQAGTRDFVPEILAFLGSAWKD